MDGCPSGMPDLRISLSLSLSLSLSCSFTLLGALQRGGPICPTKLAKPLFQLLGAGTTVMHQKTVAAALRPSGIRTTSAKVRDSHVRTSCVHSCNCHVYPLSPSQLDEYVD